MAGIGAYFPDKRKGYYAPVTAVDNVHEHPPTSHRTELLAPWRILKKLKDDIDDHVCYRPSRIFTDLAFNARLAREYVDLRMKGYCKANGQPFADQDLVKRNCEMIAAINGHYDLRYWRTRLEITHVNSHRGHFCNEKADDLARLGQMAMEYVWKVNFDRYNRLRYVGLHDPLHTGYDEKSNYLTHLRHFVPTYTETESEAKSGPEESKVSLSESEPEESEDWLSDSQPEESCQARAATLPVRERCHQRPIDSDLQGECMSGEKSTSSVLEGAISANSAEARANSLEVGGPQSQLLTPRSLIDSDLGVGGDLQKPEGSKAAKAPNHVFIFDRPPRKRRPSFQISKELENPIQVFIPDRPPRKRRASIQILSVVEPETIDEDEEASTPTQHNLEDQTVLALRKLCLEREPVINDEILIGAQKTLHKHTMEDFERLCGPVETGYTAQSAIFAQTLADFQQITGWMPSAGLNSSSPTKISLTAHAHASNAETMMEFNQIVLS